MNPPAGKMKLYFPVVVNIDTAIAPGGVATFTQKIDADSPFVVQAIQGTLFPNAVVLTSTIAGTPYPREGSVSPTTTGNTFATLAHFRIQVNTASNDWFQLPVRCNLLFGSGERQHILTEPRAIGFGQDLKVTIFNDTAATFNTLGQIMFEGYKFVSAGQVR